ncbi:GNAT family N-acetyltransferase [Rheinheimera texasensis]|uniref:GNAT family N-acetyltransferase n=1 Tax=Rheinheimera texasensis TaxID=306205 RepID=UPI00056D8F54|nr:GNAT family N-acetyltransferase [Rheinheimera texasensis]
MQVQHQIEQCCFIYQAEGAEARLEYRLFQVEGQSAVDFYHTFVPPEFRGQGIAALLTKVALEWARHQQLKIYASCSYVARHLEAAGKN